MNFSPKKALTPPPIRSGHLLSPLDFPEGDLRVGEEGWGVRACY
jgi:hypothetical protein